MWYLKFTTTYFIPSYFKMFVTIWHLYNRGDLKLSYSEKGFLIPQGESTLLPSRLPVGSLIHWAMGDLWWARLTTRFWCVWDVSCYTAVFTMSKWWLLWVKGSRFQLVFWWVMGSTAAVGSEKIFFWVFNVRAHVLYLHFIHVPVQLSFINMIFVQFTIT